MSVSRVGGDGFRRRRVVFCVQNLSVPQDPRVWREARDLAAAGHEVFVICPRVPGQARRADLEGVRLYRYPEPPELPGLLGQVTATMASLFWTTLIALRITVGGPVDALHAANPPDTFFLVGLLLRPFGTRFVFDQHDACPELLEVRSGPRSRQRPLLRALESLSFRTASLVVAPNESYRRLALGRGGRSPDQVVVVRSGPDEVDAERAPPPAGPAVVAFAGAMDPQDGVDLLLSALAPLLEERGGAVVLDLIGKGDAVEDLRRETERLGIADRVRWPGWLDAAGLRARLRDATVAVSPDRENAFTRVSTMTKVTDYLSVGAPSVIADLPENRATAGDAASYFRPGDPHDLAKRVEELLDDPAGAMELSRRALDRAEQLRWRHSSVRLTDAYDGLVGAATPTERASRLGRWRRRDPGP